VDGRRPIADGSGAWAVRHRNNRARHLIVRGGARAADGHTLLFTSVPLSNPHLLKKMCMTDQGLPRSRS
jgi:hypothetical protein